MINTLARTYVIVFLVLGILALAITTFLHIRALFGMSFSIGHLFVLDFASAVPLLGLAKERNIGANEIKALPKWVKPLIAGLLFYSFFIAVLVIFGMGKYYPSESPIVISSFFCAFLSASVCVPIAILKPGYLDSAEVEKRVRTSILVVAVAALCVTIAQYTKMPSH